ncbi:MAG: hypothetical protein AAGJ28_17935, partial [Pseudomonadota bacterium]
RKLVVKDPSAMRPFWPSEAGQATREERAVVGESAQHLDAGITRRYAVPVRVIHENPKAEVPPCRRTRGS